MHYVNKMSIALGNFSFSSAYADLGYYWAPMLKSLEATGLVEADKSTALYSGVWWV